jgi:ketosteroid isomerase-like protein
VDEHVFDQQIRDLYAAFNRRDSSYVTDRMSPDVTWPRAFKGGVVQGPDAVRAYWEDQWREIDPHVEPVEIERRADGRYDVEVHQVVRDLSGAVLADVIVHHVYTFDGSEIVSMEIS